MVSGEESPELPKCIDDCWETLAQSLVVRSE